MSELKILKVFLVVEVRFLGFFLCVFENGMIFVFCFVYRVSGVYELMDMFIFCFAILFGLLLSLCALYCDFSVCWIAFSSAWKIVYDLPAPLLIVSFSSPLANSFRMNEPTYEIFFSPAYKRNYLDFHCKYFGYLLKLFSLRLWKILVSLQFQ